MMKPIFRAFQDIPLKSADNPFFNERSFIKVIYNLFIRSYLQFIYIAIDTNNATAVVIVVAVFIMFAFFASAVLARLKAAKVG